jgi:hypothetical protein
VDHANTERVDLGPSGEEGLRCQLAELMYRLAGVCGAVSASYGADVDDYDLACRGEADAAYRLVARHVAGIEVLADPDAQLAQRAAALMRRLGGCWSGDGCLYACAVPPTVALRAESDDDDVVPARCTWSSLDDVEAAAGLRLV